MTRSLFSFVAFASLALAATRAHAQAPATLTVAKDGHLWLEGDSTLHKYKLNATEFAITFASGDATGDVSTIITGNALKSFLLRVPVAQLTSGEKGLDDNMRKALLADKNPEISFQMRSYQTTPAANGTFTAHMKGVLSIAGTQHLSELDMTGTPSPNGVHFVGEKRVLMSSYGVKPPVLMLGTLKTADAIDVKFDFTVTKSLTE